jgi:hypothetical protein
VKEERTRSEGPDAFSALHVTVSVSHSPILNVVIHIRYHVLPPGFFTNERVAQLIALDSCLGRVD